MFIRSFFAWLMLTLVVFAPAVTQAADDITAAAQEQEQDAQP